ncbi:hypothetical protein L6452_20439 [Arctium lappa]|uniref:Uncharacterized protein n=1 Tax=Arctium lappa TaxID=4217 RepID=A0ACB9BAU8_ARCLA|nr:hypothetical protein L6452_20439 [Arctium lappa]
MDRIRILSFVAICCFLTSSMVVAPPTCSQINPALVPCVPFLKGIALEPSIFCCIGTRVIKWRGKTTKDRVAICNCAKQMLTGLIFYDPKRFPQLDEKCGVKLNYPPISKDLDCKK